MERSITFVVNSEPPDIRVAELRNGRMFDVDIERGSHGLGNIYRGVIANVIPGMEVYFVDLGLPKKGMLHFKDCAQDSKQKRSEPLTLRVGQPVLVQIARPGVGKKGPRLTLRLSLPGRYLVLVAPWDAVGVSRRIASENERARLKTLAEKWRPLDYGLIIRTEAEGITEDLIKSDVVDLVTQIHRINEHFQSHQAPELIHRELGLLGRIIRDRLTKDVDKVIIDSQEEFDFCRQLVASVAPELVDRVHYYSKPKSIFESFGVERVLSQAQQKTIMLPHGGSIVIEETEALTAVDVNTGRFVGKTRMVDTVLQTNLEAVDEVALQLRLRGIGGIIVVDFIDMERTRDRIRVMDALEAALKPDHVKTRIVQLSPSGLVEITRQREGLSIRQLLNRPCPVCKGEGVIKTPETVAIQARRQIRQLSGQEPSRYFKIKCHPAVAAAFVGSSAHPITRFENSIGAQVIVRVDPRMHLEATQIEISDAEFIMETTLTRFTLGMHDPLYPEEAPEFGVCGDLLVMLPTELPVDDQQSRLQQIVVLEITAQRWFATSTIVRSPSGNT